MAYIGEQFYRLAELVIEEKTIICRDMRAAISENYFPKILQLNCETEFLQLQTPHEICKVYGQIY